VTLAYDHVSVAAGGRRIVTDVTLHVPSGGLVGLIGPNGSGKSTLLRTAYRMLRPSAGAVWLGGDDVHRLPYRTVARRLAVVRQEQDGDFEFTVAETVAMGRTPHKGLLDREADEDRRLVADALERVGMASFAGRRFVTLSGGEKQRVLVARAIAQRARYLLLDEPTNHLDVRYQLEIMDLVAGLGATVLAALHDLNIAAAYCDRVYVLQAGRIVASGSLDQVLSPELVELVYGVRAGVVRHPLTGDRQLCFLSPSRGALLTPVIPRSKE